MRHSWVAVIGLSAALAGCSKTEKIEAARTYQMGERVQVGNLSYVVSERQWHNEFGSGPDARLPQNRFFLVKMSVLDNGRDEVIIPNTQLVDDAGLDYPEAADGDGVQDWIGNTRQLSPGKTVDGYLLFDVPPKHYKLRVFGEEEKQVALVDIPLSFDSDAPDVTVPVAPPPRDPNDLFGPESAKKKK